MTKTYRCVFTGREFKDADKVFAVMFYDHDHAYEPAECKDYHGLDFGRSNIGVFYVEKEHYYNSDYIQCRTYIKLFSYTYDDEQYTGAFVRNSGLIVNGTSYRSLGVVYHAIDHSAGQFSHCPTSFMRLIGSDIEYGHASGNAYYSYDDIPYEDTSDYADEHDDDDDDDDSDDPRGEYHEGRRSWERNMSMVESSVSEWKIMKQRPIRDRRFGVELEIKANDRSELHSLCSLAGDYGFLAEQDGSLDDYLGVEIVAPPFSLADLSNPDGKWMQFLKKAARHAICWNAGSVYSMHVSVNRTAMSPATAGKFVNAIHKLRELGVKLAGRESHNYACYVTDPYPKHQHIHDGANSCENDKFRAASVRSPARIEVRIFRGSLNPHRFIRNVQYCSAIWDWTTVCGITQSSNEKLFLDWLMKDNQHHYPHLAAWVVEGYGKDYTLVGKARKLLTKTPATSE